MLLRLLEHPNTGAAVRSQLAALLADSEGVRLVADTGLPNDRGLLNETADRLFRRLLPSPRDDHDLSALLLRLFPGKQELAFLESIPDQMFGRLCAALGTPDGGAGPFARLQGAVADAWVLIAARVQGLGLSHPIRQRSRPLPLSESPFLALPRAGDRIIDQLEQARRQRGRPNRWSRTGTPPRRAAGGNWPRCGPSWRPPASASTWSTPWR